MALLAAVAVWILTGGPATAQQAPLGEIELPSAPIVVNLDGAVLTVVTRDDAEPRLRWWRDIADAPGSAELEAFEEGAAVVIQRPELSEGETAARLRVELIVDGARSVAVYGSAVDLTMRRTVTSEPEPSVATAEPALLPPTETTLQLVDSEVSVVGFGGVNGTFDNCAVEIRDTLGNHVLAARNGPLRLHGHRGNVSVRGEGADVTAEDAGGQLTFNVAGGSVSLRSTQGRLKIDLIDAHLQILESTGTGVVVASDSNGDLRDCRFQTLNLKSTRSHINMAACSGANTIDVSGGSLTIDTVTGNVTGNVRDGGRIELTDQRGDAQLNVQQDAAADLRTIRGDVNLRARGANVSVDDANSLTVALDRSWATLTGVRKLTSFQVSSSDVELDLSESRETAVEIGVQADSVVRVRLGTPCRVKATGLDSSLASQVDVTGCELQLGQGGRWATRRARGIDGQRPVTLTAKVAESAELVVQGRP